MNQYIPGNHLTKIEILKKACFVSAKINRVGKYHNAPNLVNTLYNNFTILSFLLYHAKVIKQESKIDHRAIKNCR